MSRPKVAHITTVTPSLEDLLLNQMLSIQEAGYEVIGIASPHSRAAHVEAAGIRHIPVSMTRSFTPLHDLLSLWRLVRVMRRERFTIVHTHTPKAGLLGQLAARLTRVPVIVNTVHGFYFHDQMHPSWRRFYVLTERIAALCSDVILSQNHDDIQTAIRDGICSPNKIKYLGNGIDLETFDPARVSSSERERLRDELRLPSGSKVVGFVGRLAARRKGFLDFLRAGESVVRRCPNSYFLIAGSADLGKPDAVDPERARDFGLWDRCRFLGHRSVDELPALYSLMDVLVLPSLFEGMPRVVMEASAMKVPAIATNVKGNREAVIHGENGELVPFGDVPALADAIVRILEDPVRAREMGERGRSIALDRFDEQVVFRKVLDEYSRLLRQKGITPPLSRETQSVTS